ARYSNVFDYVGPNMAANTLNVYNPPTGPTCETTSPTTAPVCQQAPPAPSLSAQEATVRAIASAVGARDVVALEQPAVNLQNPSGNGRQWNGPIYVATPQLLWAYGINPSSIPSDVDILSSRSGLAGSGVQLTYGGGGDKGGGQPEPVNLGGGPGGPGGSSNSCDPGSCLAHPVVQEEG